MKTGSRQRSLRGITDRVQLALFGQNIDSPRLHCWRPRCRSGGGLARTDEHRDALRLLQIGCHGDPQHLSTGRHHLASPSGPVRQPALEHLGRRTILLLERQCQQLWPVVLGLPPLTQPLPQFGCTLLTSPGAVLFQATTLFAQGAASYFTTTGYSGRPARATGWRSS